MCKLELTPTRTAVTTDAGETLSDELALAAYNRYVDAQQKQRQRFASEHPRDSGPPLSRAGLRRRAGARSRASPG